MLPSKNTPLDYASPGTAKNPAIEKGLSNGQMAFLFLFAGIIVIFCWEWVGLSLLALSLCLAIIGCVQSKLRSVFAWLVLAAFAFVGFAIACLA